MKTKRCIVLLLIVLLFVGISCHKHSFSDQWSSDAQSHWHVATCEHDVTADSAPHTWDNGTITKEPTCTEEGIKTYTCTVCKATRTESVAPTGHSYVKGICTGCGYSLLEGDWKIDFYSLIDLYLASEFSEKELADNRDLCAQIAIVAIASELAGEEMDSPILSFDGTTCIIPPYENNIVWEYSINNSNELILTYQGEKVNFGTFDSSYTKLTCGGEFDEDAEGIVLSKNPEPLHLIWEVFFEDEPSVDKVKELITEGADVNVGRSYEGESALVYAIKEDYSDIAVALIEAGADINEKIYDMPLLAYAIEEEYSDIALALIKAGADINEKIYDMPLLAYAIEEDYSDIAIALIEAGADVNAQAEDGTTALYYELVYHDEDASVDVVKAMIAHGMDVNFKYSYGGTALIFACVNNCPNEIKLALIEAGADVNAQAEDGTTALYYELTYQEDEASVDVVKAMIAHGLDVNFKYSYGGTALMIASVNNCPNEIKLALIEAGADVNAKTEDGNTALYYELYYRDEKASADVVKAMIAHGADTSITISGYTAKEYASKYCSAEVAALFN